MQHDILAGLLEATLASSFAIVLVLLLRLPLRRMFGAQSVRGLWLIALLAPLATLLPAPKDATLPLVAVTYLVGATPQSTSAAPVAAAGDTLSWNVLLLAAWATGVLASIAVV
ncbi:MAG TPA: M56 family metallopeptidase, partial [Tahibacter sp.]|nr:M56 family metallopeptidase [Tahibacter sp.]